ncbi:hypothetical protein PISMIDRAFT_687049 [Pisolithus microcarpus 441]|uniref:Uncharacterized protein n=1 Tax=Pisolithus microcarpus 441 TaxID=765257 RepID=A0A0C9Z712_9AGAM|nr:hypothetical protein PISMIDRAFT_687049 [Pisolithus microcarpus 441]
MFCHSRSSPETSGYVILVECSAYGGQLEEPLRHKGRILGFKAGRVLEAPLPSPLEQHADPQYQDPSLA